MIAALLLVYATAYGVVPDDGADDRAALELAIAATPDGGTLVLPPGVVETTRTTATSNPDRLSDLRFRRSIVLAGAGAELTTLRMTGDCRGVARYLIDVLGAPAVLLRDMRIDRDIASTTNCGEQTHLVQASAATDLQFDRLEMSQASFALTGTQGGDCIKVVAALRVRVTWVTFRNCDRSGIAVHRDVIDLRIYDSVFDGTGDQDIDLEPPSVSIRLVRIERVRIRRTRASSSIALAKVDDVIARDVTITGGGSVIIVSGSKVLLDGWSVDCAPGPACLTIRRASRGVMVRGGSWRGGGGGPVIYAYADGADGVPGNVLIDGVTVVQPDARSAIEADGVEGFYVLRSTLIGPALLIPARLAPIIIRSVVAQASGATAANTRIGWGDNATTLAPRALGMPWFGGEL